MTVAERKRELKKHIDKLPARQLAKAEEFVFAIDPNEDKLTAEDKRKIAYMKRMIAKAERDIAEGRTTPVSELRRKY